MEGIVSLLLSWWTVVLLVVFLGIVFWVFVVKRKEDFDAAARMPLDEDEPAAGERESRGQDR